MKYKKYKIIWIDPTGDTGWHTADDIEEFECEECIIEAYVFSKDSKWVKTFASYSKGKTGEMTFGDVNVLPRKTIKSMKEIK